MRQNGIDREASNTERLIALVTRMNDAIVEFMALLRELLAGQRVSSDRLARLESIVEKVYELAIRLSHNVDEVRDDVEEVRKDQTDPRGFKVLNPAEYPLRPKDEDGALVATARLVEKVPAPLRLTLFKLAVSGGVGAALLEAWHRLRGH
jgi:hypothetical protein